MKKLSLLSIGCAVLTLSACDHYSTKLDAIESRTNNVAMIEPAAGAEMSFGQYLASEYYHLARYEQDQMYDYKAAKYYTEKAEELSRGTLVSPASMGQYKIKADKQDELGRARADLITALKTYNTPDNRYSLAMAQTRYDCWLDQQEETIKNDETLTCKNEFRHAMASLIPPNGREVGFAVPFQENSMALSEEARIALGRVLTFWENNKALGYDLSLHPDATIPEGEAEKQVSMVRSILQYNGVAPDAIRVEQPLEGQSDFQILLKQKDSVETGLSNL